MMEIGFNLRIKGKHLTVIFLKEKKTAPSSGDSSRFSSNISQMAQVFALWRYENNNCQLIMLMFTWFSGLLSTRIMWQKIVLSMATDMTNNWQFVVGGLVWFALLFSLYYLVDMI